MAAVSWFVYAEKLNKPYYIKKEINGRTIKVTECKFGLYINDKPIVERDFIVDSYNPAIRFSYEIVESLRDIVSYVDDFLKVNDVKHMWDDYDIIHAYGLYIVQIRELKPFKRKEMIEKINDDNYVRRVKNEFRVVENKEKSLTENNI